MARLSPTVFRTFIVAAFGLFALSACSGTQAALAPSPSAVPEPSPTALPPTLQPTVEPPPTPTEAPTPAGCPEIHGRIEITELTTSLVAGPLEVRVDFPPCYDP